MVKVALPAGDTPIARLTEAALRERGHDTVADVASADVVVDVGVDLADTRRAVAAAGTGGVQRYVLLSTATVYGAWPANPVPIPETAPLRPHPDFAPAVEAAEAERLVAEWGAGAPGRRTAVLRPAVVAGRRPLEGIASVLAGGGARPLQVVAEEDVASAVAVVVDRDLDGAFNVAPDGSIPPETVDELVGAPPRLGPLERVAELWPRLRRSHVPGVAAYLEHPWVVANDRLRAAGWQPATTNEEALVAASRPSWWRDVSPKRRQELALGVAGAGVVGLVVAVLLGARRVARRRRA